MSDTPTPPHYLHRPPLCHDREAGEHLLEQFQNTISTINSTTIKADILSHEEADLILKIGSCSPYLTRLINRHPSWVYDILKTSPFDSHKKSCALAANILLDEASLLDPHYKEQKKHLRHAKDHAALNIAINDLRGTYDVMDAVKALSEFADQCVNTAFTIAHNASIKRGHLSKASAAQSAICIIAMGKHGAGELNYSSDIDLVAIYDRDAIKVAPEQDAGKVSSQIIRDMVALLSDQTVDGYVFRTDLRLRPDPGVSAICISMSAAENYYEMHGQNWERAAFIKARPIAGNLQIGQTFLNRLRPFIWRKYLDYAAIADIRSIQNRITNTLEKTKLIEGFDLKLGQGGIRQIEFITQIHQLISGGKNNQLRTPKTVEALKILATVNIIPLQEEKELIHAYKNLRHLEHRIQMMNDEQTHQVPKDQHRLEQFASFSGFPSVSHLKEFIEQTTNQVRTIQQRQFGVTKTADNEYVFSFTGVEDDPQTLSSLQALGFERPSKVSELIRRWYSGTYRATRSDRSHSLMNQFIPVLLRALAKSSNPDVSFFAFDSFLSRLPSGVQVFSLFVSRPEIFDRLCDILTISPKLANTMAKHHRLLEALIEDGWLSHSNNHTHENNHYHEHQSSLGQKIIDHYQVIKTEHQTAELDFETTLNIIRRLSGEARFMEASRLANEKINPIIVSQNLTRIADDTIKAVVPAAQAAMHQQYGDIEGALCVIGFGRLGNQCMTYASDVDLVIIYDIDPDTHSTGNKPIDAVTWYTRMVRRLITALSINTEEGKLYEVDMQLRPSGGAGPTAVKFSAFKQYYENDAWIWEMMALTKARIIYGDAALCAQVQSEIENSLKRQRNKTDISKAVKQMRQKLLENKPSRSIWDRKRILGGLTEIEFIVQFLTLITAAKIGLPHDDIKASSIIICRLNYFHHHGYITDKNHKILTQSYLLNENIIQLSRLSDHKVFDPEKDSIVLTNKILNICACETLEQAIKRLEQNQKEVSQIFNEIVS